MDLVRDILIKTADAEGSISIEAFVDEDRSMDLVAYHVVSRPLCGERHDLLVSCVRDSPESEGVLEVGY